VGIAGVNPWPASFALLHVPMAVALQNIQLDKEIAKALSGLQAAIPHVGSRP